MFDSRGTDEADFAIIGVFHSVHGNLFGLFLTHRGARWRLSASVSGSSRFVRIAILRAHTSTSAPGPMLSFIRAQLTSTSSTALAATAVLARGGRRRRLRVGHLDAV